MRRRCDINVSDDSIRDSQRKYGFGCSFRLPSSWRFREYNYMGSSIRSIKCEPVRLARGFTASTVPEKLDGGVWLPREHLGVDMKGRCVRVQTFAGLEDEIQ